MRVLVVDQDSASNEAIVRSLREHYTVDAVTNKGDCLDLLRSNTFEAIVAAERLEDGSGLELLGQIGKRWPAVLRIFAADRQRLQLLRGRLGPFDLFQTLTYPIDPERLIATLDLAGAAQDAHADTTNIQHVVLSATPPPEFDDVGDVAEETEEAAQPEESEDFPPPRPAARVATAPEPVRSARRPAVSESPMRPAPAPRPRGNGAAGAPRPAPAMASASRATVSPASASRTAGRTANLTRSFASTEAEPSAAGDGGNARRHGRVRSATNRPPPVRFPPLESPRDFAARRSGAADDLTEAATLARAARSNFESSTDEPETKRLAMMLGGGAAAVLVVILLGFKLFGSKSQPPAPPPAPVVQAPQYPAAVTDLIAQTENALKADDFKTARVDVDKLRQLAPSHPRLAFFDGLLAQKADALRAAAASVSGHSSATAKRGGKSAKRPDSEQADAAAAPTSSPPQKTASKESVPAASAEHELSPETPPGITRAAEGSTAPAAPASAAPASGTASGTSAVTATAPGAPESAAPQTAVASAPPPAATIARPAPPVSASTTAATALGPAAAAQPVSAQTTPLESAPVRRPSSGEPPPVIQEAKLIRSVTPDYPSAAKHDSIEGSVDLEVTVSEKGVVEDVKVLRATPPDVFDKSAIAAVRKWKYDPRFVDGLPAQAHLKVHLDFAPNR